MRLLLFLVVGVVCLSCSSKKDYSPESWLSAKEQDQNVWKIIRYLAKTPDDVVQGERFQSKYDSLYMVAQSLHRLDAYYIDGDTHYFLISRRAPSVTEKFVATGGKMKFDDKGELTEYEEVFRTWKMKGEDLKKKSSLLFDLMVKGQPLEKYETRFSQPEEYIEFPDEHTYYDKQARAWKMK